MDDRQGPVGSPQGGLPDSPGPPLDRPYRGPRVGRPRGVPLPPDRMPLVRGWQLRKRWHYATFWSAELLLCVASVQVGFLRQEYWAVWDRTSRRLWTRTHWFRRRIALEERRLTIEDGDVAADIAFVPADEFEVYAPVGRAYNWGRKQLCLGAAGTVSLAGHRRAVEGSVFVDVTAGYLSRRTAWRWMAGTGTDQRGGSVAWTALVGLMDSEEDSERTVWEEGRGREIGPVRFSSDLSIMTFAEGGELRFQQESVLRKRVGLFLIKSRYDHAFGRFSGVLPGGIEVRDGVGVRERQDALW